ncbi:MAG: YabP/YqfC family sporulation protein [Candidatus Fimivivens sp.]
MKRKMKRPTTGKQPMKNAISRVLELPESTLTGGLHIEMHSNHEAVVANCGGVLEYTPQIIRLITGGMVIKFSGRELTIGSLNRNITVVSGVITAVEFLF